TGFWIPTAQPPAGETDGPLGALFLARALAPVGVKMVIVTDGFCVKALQAGLRACGLLRDVPVIKLPDYRTAMTVGPDKYWDALCKRTPGLTHLVALERVGPNHTLGSMQVQLGCEAGGETYLRFLAKVPDERQDRCHTMRGRDITPDMSPAHWL